MKTQTQHLALLDLIKLFSCLMIFLHHWSIYAYFPYHPQGSWSMDALFHPIALYGKWVTAFFFSISGFLLGRKFLVEQAPSFAETAKTQLIRMLTPYYLTIGLVFCAMLACVVLRLPLEFSPAPTYTDLLAHLVLLQDLVHRPSFSAGFWYVSIHLQLIFFSLLLLQAGCLLPQAHQARAWLALIGLSWLVSAFYFNLDSNYEPLFVYFFSGFGLGLLAAWCLHYEPKGMFIVCALGLLSLAYEFRVRLFLSLLLSGFVFLYYYNGWSFAKKLSPFWQNLSNKSYRIFLFHYPIIVVVNGIFYVYVLQNQITTLLNLFTCLVITLFLATVSLRPPYGH